MVIEMYGCFDVFVNNLGVYEFVLIEVIIEEYYCW